MGKDLPYRARARLAAPTGPVVCLRRWLARTTSERRCGSAADPGPSPAYRTAAGTTEPSSSVTDCRSRDHVGDRADVGKVLQVRVDADPVLPAKLKFFSNRTSSWLSAVQVVRSRAASMYQAPIRGRQARGIRGRCWRTAGPGRRAVRSCSQKYALTDVSILGIW